MMEGTLTGLPGPSLGLPGPDCYQNKLPAQGGQEVGRIMVTCLSKGLNRM
jgi:hypothetical protein